MCLPNKELNYMKKLLKYIILFVTLYVLTGCNEFTFTFDGIDSDNIIEGTDSKNITETNPIKNESEIPSMRYQEYFDFDKEHRPTEEQIMKVKPGMNMSEVVSIMGKPHNFGPTSGVISVEWEADNGKTYVATVMCTDEMIQCSKVTVEDILSQGVIVNNPHTIE